MSIPESIEDMNFQHLSRPLEVFAWFGYPRFYLSTLGDDDLERQYLAEIEDIVRRTGANSFFVADYVMRLEIQVRQLQDRINQLEIELESPFDSDALGDDPDAWMNATCD